MEKLIWQVHDQQLIYMLELFLRSSCVQTTFQTQQHKYETTRNNDSLSAVTVFHIIVSTSFAQ